MRTRTMMKLAAVWVIAALCSASFAVGYDVTKDSQDGTAIPDVNKPVFGDPNDNSCWMAVASNMLGASGYGVGVTAQAKADYIYGQLRTDLNWQWQGSVPNAINYWLYTYGKNPDAVEFNATNPYTDVTWSGYVPGGLTSSDYDMLLGELARCQYVGVGFTNPEHAMTLVGGNYSNNPGGDLTQSVWHDSDRNNVAPGDDVYSNRFSTGQWDLIEYPISQARDWTTLCPGLNKPESAMLNFDVAWYRQTQNLIPDFRQAGASNQVYEAPDYEADPSGQTVTTDAYWLTPAQGDPTEVVIPNEHIPLWEKRVYLLVDYYDRVIGRSEDILLEDDLGNVYSATWVSENADGGQLLFCWELPDQPFWEKIIFPDTDYYTLSTYVKDWDLATECVPEPAFASMLLLGALQLLRKRRRHV